jgi:lincosamide nucleotidyltransferase A/C/D/E
VLHVLDLADTAGARLWLDGGWGIDALLGEQTREHGDLDVTLEARHLDAFLGALAAEGFTPVGEEGATPWNFLLCRRRGGRLQVLDLHVVVLDAEGKGVVGPPEQHKAFPAASLTGRGQVGGRDVDCISAPWVVRFHDTYAGDAKDRTDVRAVCERFGLEVPEQYR